MRKFLSILAVVAVLCFPMVGFAANGTGHGTNGNSGNGVSGSTGNQGGGVGQGDAGGHHGGDGHNGGGHDGGGHDGGGSTGGTTTGGSTSVSTPSVSVSTSDGGGTQTVEARGAANEALVRKCQWDGGFYGLVDYRMKQDGSFVYWGVEYALPSFVQCMKDHGVQMGSAGRNDLTNFGAR